MPKRSNEFQRLIHDIHLQLHERATVTESRMLPDRRGGPPREVDVVIEDASGEYPILIGIECIDHKRRADVRWVEQMGAKHDNLTDKLVLVSRIGFWKPAVEEAARRGIIRLSLTEALDADWNVLVNRVRSLSIGTFQFWAQEGYMVLEEDGGTKVYRMRPDRTFFDANGQPLATAVEVARHLLNHPDLNVHLMQQVSARPDLKWSRIEIDMAREVYVGNPFGRMNRLRALRFDVLWATDFAPVELQSGALGKVQVAWGEAVIPGQRLSFVATEREGSRPRATLRLSFDGRKETHLIELSEYPDDTPRRYNIIDVPETALV